MSAETRLLRALRALVLEVFPRTAFLSVYRYRVVSQTLERLTLQAVRRDIGLPDLAQVSVQPGMAGLKAELALGAVVLLGFVEGDPTLPYVSHFSRPGEPGWKPVTLLLDAEDEVDVGETATTTKLGGGVLGGARMTDTVQAGPYAGTITGGSSKVLVG